MYLKENYWVNLIKLKLKTMIITSKVKNLSNNKIEEIFKSHGILEFNGTMDFHGIENCKCIEALDTIRLKIFVNGEITCNRIDDFWEMFPNNYTKITGKFENEGEIVEAWLKDKKNADFLINFTRLKYPS